MSARFYFCAVLLFLGGPAFAADAQELTYAQAVDFAVARQLNLRLAKAQTDFARAQALQAASQFLPSITGTLSETRVFRQNLAALGFKPNPLFPTLIGPYNIFDARVQLVDRLLDLSAIRQYQSGRLRAKMAGLEENLVRDQVAAGAGLAFVDALRAAHATESAEADLKLANALKKLAEDQHRSGVATGVDVARARTRAAEAQLKFLQVKVVQRESELRLKRAAGIALKTALVLKDDSAAGNPPVPEADAAVAGALKDRLEIRITEGRLEADREQVQSARFQYFPALLVNGNVGSSGNLPDRDARVTGAAGVGLQMPLWPSAAVKSQINLSLANAERSQALAEDAREQVEEDVRLAMEALQTSVQEVQTAGETVALAEQELKLSRDRFSAGVGDNIELINAQDVAARAHDAQVDAVSHLQVARINFALSLGKMGGFHL